MKTVILFVGFVAFAAANEIDWSKVRPIEEFDHYWARLPKELQVLQQSIPNPRITNGREATPGQFPHQAVLLVNFFGYSGLCGASVLTNNYILSSAHCLQCGPQCTANGGTAILGAHNYQINEPSQQLISFGADGINIHPEYQLDYMRNDIATIRLNNGIIFNDRIQPITIPSISEERSFAGRIGTVSGFGRTSDSVQGVSPVLRFAANPIITIASCRSQWNNNVDLIHTQHICLSGDGGRSSCYGDSGGPLTIVDDNSRLLIGVVSFNSAAGCAQGFPSVYTRVSHFSQWIIDHTDFVTK